VQYYNLIHLGFNGYREIMENCLANARILSKSLEATGWYTCVSDIHRPAPETSNTNTAETASTAVKDAVSSAVGHTEEGAGPGQETSAAYTAGLPVVSFRFSDQFRREYPHIKQETVSLLLRARQWIIPNYALPPSKSDTEILRVVIRVSMSFDLLDRLVTDIVQVTEQLMEKDEVDLLGVLHEPKHRKKPVTKEERAEKAKKREERKHKGEAVGSGVKEAGKDVKKRMEDGIHRTVC
jgi:glutamate decarboxylase